MTPTVKRPLSLLILSTAIAIPALAPAAANGPQVYSVTEQYGSEPSITVTAQRSGSDQRINASVVAGDRGDGRISGRIGVDTLNANVTLTGRVMTPAMAERAASDARSVDGVADVTNYIRARVGEE